MRRLTSIVAVNPDGVIGSGNQLPWKIRSDMRFFKAQTSGNVVIMGRKTYDSLGGGLKNRTNIVISQQQALFDDSANCVLRHGVFEALAEAETAPESIKEIFVIGGSTLYEQFAPLVDRTLITIVHKAVPNGDAFFDQGILGDTQNWSVSQIGAGSANADGDEADYEIFEMLAKNPDQRYQRRRLGIEMAQSQIKPTTHPAERR